MKILALLLSILLGLCFVTPVSAQATRTWVSGVGDDVNPCSRTAPCKTFAGAISKTATNGEINCLDPAGYGTLTIVKSITIDCSYTYGSVLASSTTGFLINFDSFTDTNKTVRIRGLTFNGASTGVNGIRILGATNALGSEVDIENVVIDGFLAGTGRAISDERTSGGELSVTDSYLSNVAGICIGMLTGSVRKDAIIDNVTAVNCNIGLFAGNLVKASVTNSTFSLNAQIGINADSGSEVNTDYSTISGNATGVTVAATAVHRMANSTVTLNATGFSGTTQSYGNNRTVGNGVIGVNPTLIGAATPAFGQQ